MFCVYITIYSGGLLPPFYIGYTRTANVLKGYHGSVRSKKYREIWTSEIRNNRHLFKTIILSTHDTRVEATEKETFLQEKLRVHLNPLYINLAVNGKFFFNHDNSNRRGIPHSETTKIKISNSKKGVLKSDEFKRKCAERNTGQTRPIEWRKAISQSKMGKSRSEETKQKIRDTIARKKLQLFAIRDS